jgi:hypothetical protein
MKRLLEFLKKHKGAFYYHKETELFYTQVGDFYIAFDIEEINDDAMAVYIEPALQALERELG